MRPNGNAVLLAGSIGKSVDGRDAVTDVETLTLWMQVERLAQ